MDSNDVNINDWETNSMEQDFDEEGDEYVEVETKDTEKGKNVMVTKPAPKRKIIFARYIFYVKFPN